MTAEGVLVHAGRQGATQEQMESSVNGLFLQAEMWEVGAVVTMPPVYVSVLQSNEAFFGMAASAWKQVSWLQAATAVF